MAKIKKAYFCSACGNEQPKWMGRCPACGEWNTFVEEIVAKEETAGGARSLVKSPGGAGSSRPVPVSEIVRDELERIDLGIGEVNRVLGGGMVPGSFILLGGEPGIGKSTLSLQIALGSHGLRTLYVSGEESPQQIKMRAERVSAAGSEECYVYAETLLENTKHWSRTL